MMTDGDVDAQYRALVERVLTQGEDGGDRTGTGTRSVFGHLIRFDLSEEFPLLQLKRTWFRGVKTELFWLLGLHRRTAPYGRLDPVNIRYLVDEGVSIWTDWPYRRYREAYTALTEGDRAPVSQRRFEWGISNIDRFAAKWGGLGPVYGAQWRGWTPGGADQVTRAQRMLRERPDSRRIIVSAWNVAAIPRMLLAPCHVMFQLRSRGTPRRLSLHVHLRSNDVFLGAPFNIASYALLAHIMARATGHEVGALVYSIGDAHLYSDHLPKAERMLERESPAGPPTQLSVDADVESFDDWEPSQVSVAHYSPRPAMPAGVAV